MEMNQVEILIRYSGLTQKEFAKKTGVTERLISNYKTGKVSCSVDRFFEWCELFEVKDYNIFKLNT